METQDDSRIWVHLTAHAVADRNGVPLYFECFVMTSPIANTLKK